MEINGKLKKEEAIRVILKSYLGPLVKEALLETISAELFGIFSEIPSKLALQDVNTLKELKQHCEASIALVSRIIGNSGS